MMELGARELLIVLGALVILVILIDGVRRVRNAKYDHIRISRRKQPIFDNDGPDEFGSELPNGGARVVSYREELDPEEAKEIIRKAAEAGKPKLSIQTKSKPEQRSLGLDDSPPVLNDPVASRQGSKSTDARPKVPAPDISDKRESSSAIKNGTESATVPTRDSEPQAAVKPTSNTTSPKQPASPQADKNKTPSASPGTVLVFHMMARKGQVFDGQTLLQALLDQGLRYGSMKIFHRHLKVDGSGPVLFSLANSVEPGTFDLDAMDDFTTPGVSFFISLDAQDNPADAFGTLLETVTALVKQLDGELKDETRSAVTRQTIEHYWQRVREFERRALSESL